MKLVIDIPEEEYNNIKGIKYVICEGRNGKRLTAICLNSIANGTPLEDIKIGLKEIRDRVSPYKAECYGLDVALEYIDNWIKGE